MTVGHGMPCAVLRHEERATRAMTHNLRVGGPPFEL
jgi:hypothetical protein